MLLSLLGAGPATKNALHFWLRERARNEKCVAFLVARAEVQRIMRCIFGCATGPRCGSVQRNAFLNTLQEQLSVVGCPLPFVGWGVVGCRSPIGPRSLADSLQRPVRRRKPLEESSFAAAHLITLCNVIGCAGKARRGHMFEARSGASDNVIGCASGRPRHPHCQAASVKQQPPSLGRSSSNTFGVFAIFSEISAQVESPGLPRCG
jgi:hypothetical protein